MNFLEQSQRLFWATAVLAFGVIFLLPGDASAATISVSPNFGGFSPGQTFTAKIIVSSPDKSLNAVSGILSFPAALLSVSSVSKSNSIVNLWVQEPTFSNSNGTVSFEGVVLNPGYVGNSGLVLTVNFLVKSSGVANLAFSSGSVLANDGNGTQILSDLKGASYTIAAASGGQATTPAPAAGTPLAPQIISPTNPNPDDWYNVSAPKFLWDLPPDVTAVRLLFNKSPLSEPTIVYDPPISEKQLDKVADGTYYFHAQFKNANGWGDIAHFRFQIDTAAPDKFQIRFIDTTDTTNPTPTVVFNTTDEGSGVDYYKVKIGDQDFFVVSVDKVESNPYTLPVTSPGRQTILVQAFDKAGNYETAFSEFIISSLPAPVITDYSSIIRPTDIFAVKGSTVPLANVVVWFEKNGAKKSFTGLSDASGLFTIAGNGSALNAGSYKLWAEAIDSRGARTAPSEKYDVSFESPYIFKIGSYAINVLTLVVSVSALSVLLILILWHFWKRVIRSKRVIGKESREASRAIHKEFVWLKERLRLHMKALEGARTKRELTLEETHILNDLKEEIDKVEEVVEENIKEIKRNL